MSGMEPLAVLGLACSVMQVISFSRELLSVSKAVHRGQSINPSADTIADQLTKASNAVSQSLMGMPKALDADETGIANIAQECLRAANNLTAKLDRITGGGKARGSSRAVVTTVVRKIWNKNEIEELESMLRAHRNNLELRLLQRTWYVAVIISQSTQLRLFSFLFSFALFMRG
jgi:hypothetical protein